MAPSGYAAAGFFGFRTPILPFDLLLAWSSGLRGPAAAAGDLEAALASDREALRAHLRAAAERPQIRAAIALASPDLDSAVDAWLRGDLGEARRARVERSLIRYLARMAGRPTPFGLCAAFSTGGWGPESRLTVPELGRSRRRTRLDMACLAALAEALGRRPAVRQALRYRPNPTLFRSGGRIRYLLTPGAAEADWACQGVALEPSGPLEATLARAAAGARAGSLARALAGNGRTLAEAGAFIQQLIDAQVLVSGLQPAVTGADALTGLAAMLAAHRGTAGLAAELRACRQDLLALDAAGWAADPGPLQGLARRLQALGAPAGGPRVAVDLHKPWPDLRLGPKVRRALEAGVELLGRLGPAPADPLKSFREAFRGRFGTRWVPLLEALDPEAGVGPGGPGAPAPLLAGLDLGGSAGPGPAPAVGEVHLVKRLLGLGGRLEWELDESDLTALAPPRTPAMPDALAVLATLAAESAAALDAGDFQFLMERFHGPSGVRLLGRFCQGDPRLARQVRSHLAAEAALRPGAVFAELVHLPPGPAGNIHVRPVLRAFELPCLGRSGAPASRQILLQDLLLGLQGERLVLWSRRLDREVVPRLGCAHDYSRRPGPYQFLAELQDQDGGTGGWSWGALGWLPFLPRVRRGRQILARARWTFQADEIRALRLGPGAAAQGRLRAFRDAARLPRHVLLAEGDHLLPVDLDHPLWVEACLGGARPGSPVQFLELLPGPGAMPARGPEGRFCHELVLPFLARREPAPAFRSGPPPLEAPRTFPPGAEWLTVKGYLGASGANRFLVRDLPPLLRATRNLWDRWFFLRYADPGLHLRLRFHGAPDRLNGELLPLLQRAFAPRLADGAVWRLQIDTYERELDRYGGAEGMAASEDLFWFDSEAVLDLLRAYPGDAGMQMRWRMGLKAVDGLLAAMGFDLPARLGVLGHARAGLAREVGAGPEVEHQLGAKFRGLRSGLEALLWGTAAAGEHAGLAILAGRDARLGPVLDRLARAEAWGRLSSPRAALALSYTHLHLNRLLRTSQVQREFVIYDFLGRLYTSRLARDPRIPATAAPAPGCPPPGAG